MNRKFLKSFLIVFTTAIGLGVFYITDPAFTRTIRFKDYKVEYKWRIFNNSFCNHRTYYHCETNFMNRANAKIRLGKKLLADYEGELVVRNKLVNMVKNNSYLKRRYARKTDSSDVRFDLILKHKKELFKLIGIK